MNKVYIIAEAGVNHNGSLENALRLCDKAKEAGVDAVKFQTWKTKNVILKGTSKASYQEKNRTEGNDQYEMVEKLELSYPEFRIIKDYCDKIGIQFLSTAEENESLDFLISLGMPIIKIASGDLTNIPFLRYVAKKNLPVIISTGMASLKEVSIAYNTLVEAGAAKIAILHCTTNYPCPMNEVNLNAMKTIESAFKCVVGYSDHTLGIEVPVSAVAMGAKIIEKHFSLDKNMEGPDHKASLDPKELKQMVTAIRNIEEALGDGLKRPNKSEQEISKVVLKRIIAKRAICKGEKLSEDNLIIKRASKGIPVMNWDFVVGCKAIRDFEEDEPIILI